MVIDKDLYDLVTCSKMKTGNNYGTGCLLVHPVTRKLLLAKRTDTGNFCSPGGKVEVGESPLQGVIRETLEESNVELRNPKLYDYEMHTAPNGKNWTSFMFMCDDFDEYTIKNQESEVGEWNWYSLDEALQMDLFPPTRKSIERAMQAGVLGNEATSTEDNYIKFVECPTSASHVKDSCCCAYSYAEPEQIFTTHQGFYWD